MSHAVGIRPILSSIIWTTERTFMAQLATSFRRFVELWTSMVLNSVVGWRNHSSTISISSSQICWQPLNVSGKRKRCWSPLCMRSRSRPESAWFHCALQQYQKYFWTWGRAWSQRSRPFRFSVVHMIITAWLKVLHLFTLFSTWWSVTIWYTFSWMSPSSREFVATFLMKDSSCTSAAQMRGRRHWTSNSCRLLSVVMASTMSLEIESLLGGMVVVLEEAIENTYKNTRTRAFFADWRHADSRMTNAEGICWCNRCRGTKMMDGVARRSHLRKYGLSPLFHTRGTSVQEAMMWGKFYWGTPRLWILWLKYSFDPGAKESKPPHGWPAT